MIATRRPSTVTPASLRFKHVLVSLIGTLTLGLVLVLTALFNPDADSVLTLESLLVVLAFLTTMVLYVRYAVPVRPTSNVIPINRKPVRRSDRIKRWLVRSIVTTVSSVTCCICIAVLFPDYSLMIRLSAPAMTLSFVTMLLLGIAYLAIDDDMQ